MSAFICNDSHIAAIAGTIAHTMGATLDGAVDLANCLANENVKSVNARYGDNDALAADISAHDAAYFMANPLPEAQFVKAIDCLVYQSCETRAYGESPAFKICRIALDATGALDSQADGYNRRNDAVRNSDAYENAQWEFYCEIPPAPPALEIEIVSEQVELFPTPTAPEVVAPALPGNDADALVLAVLSIPENGEDLALAELANSHRGQMRRAAVALGLVTARESKRLNRPAAQALMATCIVRAALIAC